MSVTRQRTETWTRMSLSLQVRTIGIPLIDLDSSYHGPFNDNRPPFLPSLFPSAKLSHGDESDQAEGHRAVQGTSTAGQRLSGPFVSIGLPHIRPPHGITAKQTFLIELTGMITKAGCAGCSKVRPWLFPKRWLETHTMRGNRQQTSQN